jgi:hypothetical protein
LLPWVELYYIFNTLEEQASYIFLSVPNNLLHCFFVGFESIFKRLLFSRDIVCTCCPSLDLSCCHEVILLELYWIWILNTVEKQVPKILSVHNYLFTVFFLSMNYFLKDCNLEDNVVRQILFSEKPHPDQKLWAVESKVVTLLFGIFKYPKK